MGLLLPVLATAAGLVMIASTASASPQKDAKKTAKSEAEKAATKGDFERAAAIALKSGDSKVVKTTVDKLKKAGLKEAAEQVEKQAKAQKERATVAKKNAEKAKDSKDWQTAVANALASKDEKTVKAVMKSLDKAGKSKEGKALWEAFKRELKEIISPAPAPKPPVKVEVKDKPKPKVKVEVKDKPKAKPPVKVEAKDKPKPKVKVEVKDKPKAVSKPNVKLEQAKELKKLIQAGKRYTSSEPKSAVSDYQAANKLAPVDGMYGRGTARSLWTLYQIVPPNPYYWPSTNTKAALAEYDLFLQGIATSKPNYAREIATLRQTLGK